MQKSEILNHHKLTIITIHKGDIKELYKTLNSVDTQITKPFKHLIITPNKIHKNLNINCKYRFFIIGKDKSIYNAMNIALKKTKNSFILFLNSGDIFYNKLSLVKIYKNITENKCYIFKTYLKYKKKIYYPKEKFFNLTSYSPHPSFIRPPDKKKIFYFDEKLKVIADGIWMKKNINRFGSVKCNEVISIHNLGGISSFPNKTILYDCIRISYLKFFNELIKLMLLFIVGEKIYFNIITRINFEKK